VNFHERKEGKLHYLFKTLWHFFNVPVLTLPMFMFSLLNEISLPKIALNTLKNHFTYFGYFSRILFINIFYSLNFHERKERNYIIYLRFFDIFYAAKWSNVKEKIRKERLWGGLKIERIFSFFQSFNLYRKLDIIISIHIYIIIAILIAMTAGLSGSSRLMNRSGRDRRRGKRSNPPSGSLMIL